MPDTNFDFSVRSVPSTWSEAAEEAPKGTPGPLIDRRPGRHRLPSGNRPDLLTGLLTGIAMAVISGAAWYAIDVENIYRGPFLAPALAVLIAIAVRLGAGPTGPEQRALVASTLYVVAIFATHFFIERAAFIAVRGIKPTFGELEDRVTSDYVMDWLTAAVWLLGLGAAVWATFSIKATKR